ncbi:MAG: trypsin-like serine protease [Gemmatimonadaceae bacterium]
MTARRFIPALAVAGLLFLGCDRAATTPLSPNGSSRITNGSIDGNAHPAVVLILMEERGIPAFRCTGTLISPTVVLTAGHCTGAPGEFSGMRIFTESDVQNGNNNYPFAGPNAVEAKSWQAHPLYTSSAFFRHDVGVITLSKAVKLAADKYGKLPAVNELDALQPGSATLFTAVGYGLQKINPVFIEAEKIRMFAEPHLVQINAPGFTGDFSMLLSNNAATGGTCFGDSGGPNYLGSSSVIAGVTSFGLNGTCGGTGGVFRLDRQNVLDFVRRFLN